MEHFRQPVREFVRASEKILSMDFHDESLTHQECGVILTCVEDLLRQFSPVKPSQ